MAHRSYRWILFTLALIGFAADQSSKYGMFNYLHDKGEPAPAFPGEVAFQKDVIGGVFKFHARYVVGGPPPDCWLVKANGPVPPAVNHGALWNLGGQFKTDANTFFAVVSLLAALGISIWGIRRKTTTDRWLCIALGLILGGTLGNFFDRIVFDGVRDFLCFYWFEFPVFNVADSCLVCGASMLMFQALFMKKAEPAASEPAPAAPTPTA